MRFNAKRMGACMLLLVMAAKAGNTPEQMTSLYLRAMVNYERDAARELNQLTAAPMKRQGLPLLDLNWIQQIHERAPAQFADKLAKQRGESFREPARAMMTAQIALLKQVRCSVLDSREESQGKLVFARVRYRCEGPDLLSGEEALRALLKDVYLARAEGGDLQQIERVALERMAALYQAARQTRTIEGEFSLQRFGSSKQPLWWSESGSMLPQQVLAALLQPVPCASSESRCDMNEVRQQLGLPRSSASDR